MNKVYFKRRLQSILTDNKFDRFVGGYRSGKIEQRKLSRTAVNNNRVFMRRQEKKNKHYSVVLVVDISGSMRSRIGLAAQCVEQVYEGLLSSDVDVAIIAFNSGVEMVKDWDWEINPKDVEQHLRNLMWIQPDPYQIDKRVTRSWAGRKSTPAGLNFDFLGVQDARFMLQDREGQRIMMVYSDGMPEPTEYIPDLKKEIAKSIAEGIITLGVGVQSDSVSKFYPNYDVVNDIDELYGSTIKLLSKHIKRG